MFVDVDWSCGTELGEHLGVLCVEWSIMYDEFLVQESLTELIPWEHVGDSQADDFLRVTLEHLSEVHLV